jgi:hypothetical protein
MNKLRRRAEPIPFPPVDKDTGHEKGMLPGNMMGFPEKADIQTSHIKGEMPGNMMAYPPSKNPMPFPDESYGPRPLRDPTSIVKKKPDVRGYVGVNPENPEWTTIISQPKKGDFYGKK